MVDGVMSTSHSVENWLRTPSELWVGSVSLALSAVGFLNPVLFGLSGVMLWGVLCALFLFGSVRAYEGWGILRYQRGLLILTPYSVSTTQVPLSPKHWFLGHGFRWQVKHRQRMDLLALAHNARFISQSALYQCVQTRAANAPHSVWAKLQTWPYFAPRPDIDGKPWLHGVGSREEIPVYLPQSRRNGHTLILGTTRVGKTRLLSILVNQDIRNDEAVIVIDPKGDLELLQDMYLAAKSVGRLKDFYAIHAGFPQWSAKYNPLAQYTDVAEVAERITCALRSEGQGQVFKDFAWKYVNITALCLAHMAHPLNYQSISFYVQRPKTLFNHFMRFRLKKRYRSDLAQRVEEMQQLHTRQVDGKDVTPSVNDALLLLLKDYMAELSADNPEGEAQDTQKHSDKDRLSESGDILFDVYDMMQLKPDYYQKITASLLPLLDKINKTPASHIFSWTDDEGLPVVDFETLVKRKHILYVGLDALTNAPMSGAIGQAMVADLVSLFGRLLKDTNPNPRPLCCYFDELSEILPDAFIRLLNKAGGAGAKVTALSQTVNDLAATLGSEDKAQMLLGNFGVTIMLCVANYATAHAFTDSLETVQTRLLVPSATAEDSGTGQSDTLFTTANTDTISQTPTPLVHENDVFSLPKGQAFVRTNGGEVYKIRIPLPKPTDIPPETVEDILFEVNHEH